MPQLACSLCGSTDPENVNTMHNPELQGYSACCNEPVINATDFMPVVYVDDFVPPIVGRW